MERVPQRPTRAIEIAAAQHGPLLLLALRRSTGAARLRQLDELLDDLRRALGLERVLVLRVLARRRVFLPAVDSVHARAGEVATLAGEVHLQRRTIGLGASRTRTHIEIGLGVVENRSWPCDEARALLLLHLITISAPGACYYDNVRAMATIVTK